MQEKREVYSDYGIPIFYDNRNGEMILRDTKEFFEGEQAASYDVWKDQLLKIRGEINQEKSFLCGHCKQPIYISGRFNPQSGQKKLHFQHFKTSEENICIFYEGKHYTQEEVRRMIFNGHQESRQHKELKRIIQDCFIPIVGQEHVLAEPTLRGNDGGWRRPDIYVELPDKHLVFEVQLTYIFLSVINERNMVHRDNGRFVLWVFKDFGDGEGKTLDSERLSKLDIFAANNFNAFVLDENAKKETLLMGELYLTVYYRNYYNEDGQTKAELGRVLVAFDDLIFDEDRKLIYYFDSENKLSECTEDLKRQEEQEYQEEIKREQERQRLKRREKEIEEENRQKEIERQEKEKKERKIKRWEIFGMINQLFIPDQLFESEMDDLIDMAKSDYEFRHQALEFIYSFTMERRRDNDSFHSEYYQNPICFLTALYQEFASNGKPSVMTCLKRCWENLALIAKFPGGRDYAVEALFSPSLSNLNFKYFDFIFSPNHKLSSDQREKIQNWIREYHESPAKGKVGKDRYKHFYAWMTILNDKVKGSQTLNIDIAHRLMRDKYKIIRGVISLRFGFLSGYNDQYRTLSDVADSFKKSFPEYAGLCQSFVKPNRQNSYAYMELSNVAGMTPQNHDLDELMRILFTPSK